MSTSRLFRSLAVAAGICVLVGAAPGGLVRSQQAAPPQQADALLQRADQALYAAKRCGRNRVQVD